MEEYDLKNVYIRKHDRRVVLRSMLGKYIFLCLESVSVKIHARSMLEESSWRGHLLENVLGELSVAKVSFRRVHLESEVCL